MWAYEETVETSATPEAVWRLWADVSHWNEWDEDIVWARLDGRFESGSRGKLKPRGVPAAGFTLEHVVPLRAYTVEQRLPLARLAFEHELAPAADGRTAITQRASISGPLSGLYGRAFGRRMERNFRGIIESLARTAEGAEERARPPGQTS